MASSRKKSELESGFGTDTDNDSTAATGPGGVLDSAKQKAGEAVEQAQDTLSQVAGQAQQQAKSQLAKGKDRAADGLDTVAMALRRTSEQLQEQQEAVAVGNYTSTVADKLSDVSHRLRQSDVNQLLSETENYARRESAVFLGGAFALGMMAARFLKSSRQRLRDTETRRYDRGDSRYESRDYPAVSSYSTERTGTDYGTYGTSGHVSSEVSTMPVTDVTDVTDVGTTYDESTSFGAATGTDLLAEEWPATMPEASGTVDIDTPGMSTAVDADTAGTTGTTGTDTTDTTTGEAWLGSDTAKTPRAAEES